ncbi:ABC-2 type transport system permease protein [Weissella beninensis]|uniref:ABC transporter permease n=1 Tax=Periweissella beninensis TaxID=504936 RepID=A0ABT0VJE9_9LACO|nr:ABC transporter permease [Periweissella beninensis]MBM7544290.1 ABC-2 type transport system permease protein [Periweissella beninensis]MCM2437791.1 ABC transporter permease [Periweissella beninensis]
MRIIAIIERILKELFRDKRTLALMFIAPILVMLLMSVIFNTNSVTNVTVGTVGVSSKVTNEIKKIKHVHLKTYQTQEKAKHALTKQKIDAVIKQNGHNYHIMYANTDATKTAKVKLAFQNALTISNVKALKQALSKSTQANTQLKAQILALEQKVTQQKVKKQKAAQSPQSQKAAKISNTYVYGDHNTGYYDKILPILMSFFVFFFVFLISGMALLKERTSGTLNRLLATPVKRSVIIFGYMLSYGILAVIQTILIVLIVVWLLDIEVVGSMIAVVIMNLLLALVALAFGILLSTFANSEFQMMQFIPLVIVPQIFFSGLVPLDTMPTWIKALSYLIPLKYSGEAINGIILHGTSIFDLGFEITMLLLFLVILTSLNIWGLRRYRKV